MVSRLHDGGEQHGLQATYGEPQLGQVTRVIGVEALPGGTSGTDVTVSSRADEHRAGLERQELLARLGWNGRCALEVVR